MINNQKDKVYGMKMSEWISRVPNELDRDAVGLWQIVPAGEINFGLAGGDLIDYVRRNINALLDAGAVPVRGGNGTGFDWVRQSHFGISKASIIEAVIAEWQRVGNDVDDLMDSIWFARPRPGSKYIKMD
jgi:hypothetical protein